MIQEKSLQEEIVKKIKQSGVYELVSNRNEYESIKNMWDRSDYQPYFSINYLIRDKYVNGVKAILNKLQGDLSIVNGEKIKNVSLDKSEKLYPDIVLHNAENNKYFILELKVSKKAEREAITELMAYLLEVKNHLPLIDNRSIYLIIVSIDYSDLLQHSISSLLLNHIPVLCLKPNLKSNEFEDFNIVDIEAWSHMKEPILSNDSISAYTLCLYGKNNNILSHDDILNDLEIAIEYLKNDANIIGSHGFCIAHVDYNVCGIDSPISTGYKIDIFTVNPYKIFHENISGKSENILAKHIEKYINDHDLKEFSDNSNEELLESTRQFLRSKYSPIMEGMTNFDMCLKGLIRTGEPFLCDAWGEVGNYIKKLYIHPSFLQMFKGRPLGYKNPSVFFRLLNYLTRQYTFANGFDSCGEYLKFGYNLGEVINLCESIAIDKCEKNINKFRFKMLSLLNTFQDIIEFFKDKRLHFKIDFSDFAEIKQNLIAYVNVFASLLEENSLEKELFFTGCNYYGYFIEDSIINTTYDEELRGDFIANVYSIFVEIIEEYLNELEIKNILENYCDTFWDIAFILEIDGKTVEELIDKLKRVNLKEQLDLLSFEDKHKLIKNNLYSLLKLTKAISGKPIDDEFDFEDLLRKGIKNIDFNWALRQLKSSTKDNKKCLTVKEHGEIVIETIDTSTITIPNVNDDEILVRFTIRGSEVYIPYSIEKLSDWNKER